jgi:hypothetical protein
VLRHILISAVVLVMLSGCVTSGGTHAVATPWAAAGIHSFRPASSEEPKSRKVDAQVASLLAHEAQAPALVAAR